MYKNGIGLVGQSNTCKNTFMYGKNTSNLYMWTNYLLIYMLSVETFKSKFHVLCQYPRILLSLCTKVKCVGLVFILWSIYMLKESLSINAIEN